MIGWFGWLDVPAPTLTWLPWTAVLAFLFFVALAWASRRHAATLVALLAAVIVVPVIIEITIYHGTDTSWLGSYSLPLAVGVPILAAFALASTERGRDLVSSRFVLAVGVVVAIGQFLAFADDLRRYTVGGTRGILYWRQAEWLPPLPPLLLTVAFVAVISAFVCFVLTFRASRTERARAEVLNQSA